MRTRVKICGITSPQDAHAAVSLGADALGLVFYPPSPRAVSIEQAEAVVRDLPPFVTVVGLFVNEDREKIGGILSRVHLDLLQFHGDESPDECIGHGRPHIKAIRMRDGVDLYAERERYSAAAGLLLDTYRKDTPGGTGEAFNWGAIPAELAGSIILAGGLAPDNIEQAIKQVRPYAVDVSGGVEREKGIKDREKISAFMRGVECANR
ncbi:MAG: phosphoribosylanthranilate isomerase [Gammaproteobacteria bacterium]|nr:phosphoribosylanthranilate isomerase [Gammaproteobacteria bacterium]